VRAIRSFLSWLNSLVRRGRVERELDAQLPFHLDHDGCRDSLGLRLIDAVRQDARHTMRSLVREPGFALVVILSLALGIGANTAIFQLINAVRLRTLPVPDPHELATVRVIGGHRGLGLSSGVNSELTFALWEGLRDHQQSFSGLFAWGNAPFLLGSGADAEVVDGLWVSGDLFPVLRIQPARGRLLSAADDRRGCGASTAVLSYAFWQRHFGGDPAVVGKTLLLMDRPVPIVGVTPRGFFGLEVGKSFEVALPICAEAVWANSAERKDVWWLSVTGRLKTDWSVRRTAAHLNALSAGLLQATVPPGYNRWLDDTYKQLRLTAVSASNGSSRLRDQYETPLWLLLAMTGLVLVIACVNLANLMLARATARQREIAVRIAIGASRRRIISQFMAEGLMLAVAGGVLGVALSDMLSRGLLLLLNTEADPILVDVSPDWRVLTFAAIIAMSTCLMFALVPAIRSLRTQPLEAIKDGGHGMTRGQSFSLHRVLVASQIAFSLVLLAGAVLFVRSFRNLATLDAGFREHGIVFMFGTFAGLNLPPDQRSVYQERLLERVRSAPGVASASSTTYLPLANASWTLGIYVPNEAGEEVGDSKFTYVSPGYFDTMDVRLVAGRDFNSFDRVGSAQVAIVNETFVRRYIRGARALGAHVRTVAEPGIPAMVYEVIGVVRDTKYGSLREGTPPMTFVPATQNPQQRTSAMLAIRSSIGADELVNALRRRLRDSHPELTVKFSVFERQIRDGLSRERLMAWLAGLLGAIAAVLAVVGLYGLLSYIVQRRNHEIGIRLALGASRSSVILLVLRQTAFLVAIGLAVGLPVYLAASRSAASLLFGLSPSDLPTLAAASALLATIAACASLSPAWRAARVDPIKALRED
jgi:putative ABC transport system permease protein